MEKTRKVLICIDAPLSGDKAYVNAITNMLNAFNNVGFQATGFGFNSLEELLARRFSLFRLARASYYIRFLFLMAFYKKTLLIRSYRLIIFAGIFVKIFRYRKSQLVFEVHEIPHRKSVFRIYNKVLKSGDVRVYLTACSRKFHNDTQGLVLHDAVDISTFKPRVFEEAKLNSFICYFGSAYSGTTSKGVEVFVDGIIKSKHKSLTKIHLYLIGAANTVAEFEERYKHIEFVTVKPSLHSSQVPLVMCNYQFGLVGASGNLMNKCFSSPLKIFEYLASGLIVIAPRYPALVEIDKDESFMIFYEPDDDNWSDKLIRTLDSMPVSERRRRQSLGLDKAKEFSWDVRAKKLIEFSKRKFEQ